MTRKFTDTTLLVATHNAGKLEEIVSLLAPYGISVKGAAELNLPEPEETETTFVGNARIKAHAAAKATGCLRWQTIVGSQSMRWMARRVYTADWAETENGRDFVMAMEKTNAMLDERSAAYPRTAQFRSTLVLAWPDGHDEVFEGIVSGQLVWPMRGQVGHGYDPIFQPDGYDVTFAEMPFEGKKPYKPPCRQFQKICRGVFWWLIGATAVLGSISTGPFALPNAPIAISIATLPNPSTNHHGKMHIYAKLTAMLN